MARRCALTVTEQDLHHAWQQRRRSDWPATFEAVMAHPLLRALVRAEALRRAQAAQRQAPAPQAAPPRLLRTPNHPTVDRKRAAAGDFDD